jgi:hypothetical protein
VRKLQRGWSWTSTRMLSIIVASSTISLAWTSRLERPHFVTGHVTSHSLCLEYPRATPLSLSSFYEFSKRLLINYTNVCWVNTTFSAHQNPPFVTP